MSKMSRFEVDVSKIKKLIIYTEGEMVLEGRNNLDKDTDVIGLNRGEAK